MQPIGPRCHQTQRTEVVFAEMIRVQTANHPLPHPPSAVPSFPGLYCPMLFWENPGILYEYPNALVSQAPNLSQFVPKFTESMAPHRGGFQTA